MKSIQMNNRNQNQARATAPAEAPSLTYLNVVTVEEFESKVRLRRNGRESAQPFRIKRDSDLASS
jgi:hypothetical protein